MVNYIVQKIKLEIKVPGAHYGKTFNPSEIKEKSC